jgi:CubicO group peptidase (beta-lactamase class C family)
MLIHAQIPSINKKPVQLNDGIQTATLKDVGIDEKIVNAMTDSIIAGVYPNIHSVLILRNNKLVYEKYWAGKDEIRGTLFYDIRNHHRDSLHDTRSVTKSVVGAAVLIAHAQGKIKSLNQRVFDFFPEYTRYDTGMKRQITIQHLLNMTAGLEWDEVTSFDTINYERRMNNSPDGIQFVLRQPLVDTPGPKFNYSGGCTQLLAAIVEKATGMPIDKFTERYLFKPLGIEKYTWVKNRDGNPSAASGLRMRSRDMAKFGLLFLNNGKWNGKQIIPSLLVAQILTSQATAPYKWPNLIKAGYSNQFWVYTEIFYGSPITYAQCQGNGGQIIAIDKQRNLVLIITAGNYNRSDLKKSSWDIYHDFVFPAVLTKDLSNSITEQIKQLTYKAFSAEFKNDTAAISRLMDDNFISVYPHKTQNKHQELKGIYKNIDRMKKDDHVIDSFYLDDFKVEVYDNTAITTYYSVTKGRLKGLPFENRRVRWYDVWVNRNDEWKWVSSQGTSINEKVSN